MREATEVAPVFEIPLPDQRVILRPSLQRHRADVAALVAHLDGGRLVGVHVIGQRDALEVVQTVALKRVPKKRLAAGRLGRAESRRSAAAIIDGAHDLRDGDIVRRLARR